MARNRTDIPVLGHMAARNEHPHERHYIPDGLPNPDLPKPRQHRPSGKLDELIRASSAQNLFVGLEQMSTEEIAEIRQEVSWASRTTEEGDGRIAQPSDQSVPCASPEVSNVFVLNKRL